MFWRTSAWPEAVIPALTIALSPHAPDRAMLHDEVH
jgi:hypothetical protein